MRDLSVGESLSLRERRETCERSELVAAERGATPSWFDRLTMRLLIRSSSIATPGLASLSVVSQRDASQTAQWLWQRLIHERPYAARADAVRAAQA